jgi:hypothetical protein
MEEQRIRGAPRDASRHAKVIDDDTDAANGTRAIDQQASGIDAATGIRPRLDTTK